MEQPLNSSHSDTSKKNIFSQLSPSMALLVGLVGGILILCTIGFVILLSLYIKGGFSSTHGLNQQTTVLPTAVPTRGTSPNTPRGSVNVGVGILPALGKSTAPVTVIEFADLRCPFCERWYNNVEPRLIKDYVNTGKVKFYFRNFAFLGPQSTEAAEAAECANDQGQFWKFHNWMYTNQASESDLAFYSTNNLITYATNLGLNKTKFTNCLHTHQDASKVQKDLSDGQAAGVNGTPTVFINGKMIIGAQPYNVFKTVIDAALAGK